MGMRKGDDNGIIINTLINCKCKCHLNESSREEEEKMPEDHKYNSVSISVLWEHFTKVLVKLEDTIIFKE